MRCRAQFFSLIGALALLWCIGGTIWAISAPSSSPSLNATATLDRGLEPTLAKQMQESSNAAYVVGTGLGVTTLAAFFVCTGGPILLLCALMAWRNNIGHRTEQRHQEQLTAQQAQFSAMQQMAAAQTAQAQMQFEAHAQPVQPPAQLVSSSDNIRVQMEAAKALIDAKQYSAARNLLITIDHPKAKEWIAKIDAMPKK